MRTAHPFRLSLLAASIAGLILTGCNKPATESTSAASGAAATKKEGSTSAAASAAKSGGTAAPGTTGSTAKSATSSSTSTKPGQATPSRGGSPGRRPSEAERERARQMAAEAVPVETAPVTRGPIAAFLSFNSTLETEAVVDIYPQTSGQVEALLVEEGRIVKAGEVLLKIEDRELRVDAEESNANYEHLKKNFARTQDLFERSLVNKQDYENQAYQTEQARLRLERAKIRLSYATVRAPFDGVIASRETQVGARVAANTKLFSMVKLDDIVARVYVPGRYLPVVAENQPAVVSSEFLPDRNFQGWVKRISPVIDPKSGTFRVTVGVRGEKPSDLPPGLFVGVRIITDTRNNALLVPKRAVVYEGGERYVYAVINDKAVKRKLTVGYEDPQNLEVMSGFEVGTPVVVLGQNGLKDGSMVRLVNPAPAVAPATPPAAIPAAGNSAVPAESTASNSAKAEDE